jgi:hypothetical protein
MSSANFKKRLLTLVSRRGQLLDELLEIRPILRGSFGRIHTRCGKPTCWCAQSDKGHPHARLTWSESGKMMTRKVPAQQIDEIVGLTQSYRKFRSLRRKFFGLEGKIQALLDQYEKSLVAQARRPFAFLPLSAQSVTAKSRAQQKAPKVKNRKT